MWKEDRPAQPIFATLIRKRAIGPSRFILKRYRAPCAKYDG
jgi:hypothetical protein